jgi:hypothetical protein
VRGIFPCGNSRSKRPGAPCLDSVVTLLAVAVPSWSALAPVGGGEPDGSITREEGGQAGVVRALRRPTTTAPMRARARPCHRRAGRHPATQR